MKKILVPCDFSDHAIQAFKFALDITEQSHGEVHLLHVIELPVMHDSMLMPVLTFEESLLKELTEKTQTQFVKLKNKYANGDHKITTKVEFGGTPKMIQLYAEQEGIDLIVMGTHGASGAKELLIGSNAEKIVRTASVPVLAIKKDTTTSSINNIVFPNTLEQTQEDLTMKVKALQNFFNAKLHIVYINTPSNFMRDSVTLPRLEEFAKRFMLKDYTLNVYNDTYEESGVINFTHLVKGDLIAMGTHGRKGLVHIFSGSIAEDIVNHVDCPIWTYAIKHSTR